MCYTIHCIAVICYIAGMFGLIPYIDPTETPFDRWPNSKWPRIILVVLICLAAFGLFASIICKSTQYS